jgi:predicted ATP-grasp superfamily ATP-dependent carboligase
MGSTVFVVYQRDMKPHSNVQIMGQILTTQNGYPLWWVLTSSFSGTETIYNIVYGDYTLKVCSVNDANYKKIAIIGLQIDQTITFLSHSGVMSEEIRFPYTHIPVRTSSGAEGLSIRGNRFLYEVRIYPNSVTKEDMNAIWEEIYHTYNT